MRLIDADALKKAFNKWWGCDDIPATIVEDTIDDAPSVDTNEPTLNESIAFHNGYELGKSEREQGEWQVDGAKMQKGGAV